MLLTSTHAGHVRNNSTIPNDHDLTTLSTANRGFMIRSNSNNNIRGSTGNLKDMIMLETVAPMAAAFSNKNGGFSTASSNKKNSMSGGNLKSMYVLETVAPLVAATAASTASTSSLKAPPVPFQDDDDDDDDDYWFLGDDEEEDMDIITTRPADTITPSTPGRKPSPSPQKEEMITSIDVEAMQMKDTIHFPTIENRSSNRSSASTSSSMGSNLKDIMLETAALSSASVSSLRSSSPVPVPVPAPTLNATWSTNTSIEALKSMNRFLSIPLSAPTMPDIFSCNGGGATTSFDHQKLNKDFTKKMSTTNSTSIKKKNHHHEQHDVNLHLGKRLNEVKKDLFFKLNLPSSSSPQKEDGSSGRTTATASSTCMSPEEEVEEESFFGMETTKLSPRIMMFYQDDDEDDDDDDDDILMMAPSSASRLSFYNQVEQEETDVTNAPSAAANLSLLTDIALSLATPVSDNDNDGQDDKDDYGIFLSFSEDENEDHKYNDRASSPLLKYNVFRDHTTAPFVTSGGRQHWME